MGSEVVCCCHVGWYSGIWSWVATEGEDMDPALLFTSECGVIWWGPSDGDVVEIVSFDNLGDSCIDGKEGLMNIGLEGYVYMYPLPLNRW